MGRDLGTHFEFETVTIRGEKHMPLTELDALLTYEAEVRDDVDKAGAQAMRSLRNRLRDTFSPPSRPQDRRN